MYPRTNYEMTEEDLAEILQACKPVPLIALHLGSPPSQQENANRAWERLGKKMGFDHMTVRPASGGDRFFTAIPSETGEQRKERLRLEADEKRRVLIERTKLEIRALNGKLEQLQSEEAEGED